MAQGEDGLAASTGAVGAMDERTALDQARLARAIMGKQLALSLRVFALFFVLLFGLPLFNFLLPTVANGQIAGFTLTWLFLGVLFYPLTWLLSGYFIRESDRIETEIAGQVRHLPGGAREHDKPAGEEAH